MDMVDIAKQNDRVKYVLVAMDIFSRLLTVIPLKVKRVKMS